MLRYERLLRFMQAIGKGMLELTFFSFFWLPIAFYSLNINTTLIWLLLLLFNYSVYPLLFHHKKATYFSVLLIAACSSAIMFYIVHSFFNVSFNMWTAIAFIVFSFVFNISGFRQFALTFEYSFKIANMAHTILGHLALQLLKVTLLTEIAAINSMLIVFGVASLLLILFLTNERMLNEQQKLLGKSTVQKQALILNRLLLSIISIIVICFLLFRQWQDMLEQYIKAFLDWFIGLFNSPEKEPDEPIEQQIDATQLPFGDFEQKEPSWLIELLEKIFTMLAYVLILIFLIFIMYLIYRLIMKGINKFFHFMKLRADMLDESELTYIDEVEEIEKVNRKLGKRKKRIPMTSKNNWKSLNKQQKSQFLYTLFIRKAEQLGHEYIKHFTVKEQLNYVQKHFTLGIEPPHLSLLTTIYNAARYGVNGAELHKVTDEQLEQLYRLFTEKK